METPPPIPPQTRGNWWTRNWKWWVISVSRRKIKFV